MSQYDNVFELSDLRGQTNAYLKGYARPYVLPGQKNKELEFFVLTGQKDSEGEPISELIRVWTDHQGNIMKVLNPR